MNARANKARKRRARRRMGAWRLLHPRAPEWVRDLAAFVDGMAVMYPVAPAYMDGI